ncbi:MAG: type II toxin-antitoxin system HicB family antitoxin [Patescibacteria group bacterium]|nr:type II toxin-antitoxin system HicB family antitoxin [Patescibacteria group bacterium]
MFDRLSFILYPEPGGGFSAIAARLPGVVSEGETEIEAIDNIVEAFQGAVAFYLDERGVIPWTDVAVERTEGCKERWIVVDA